MRTGRGGSGRRTASGAAVAAVLAGALAAGGTGTPAVAAGGHGPRTERVNTAPDGSEAVGGGSYNAAISPDGRYVAFDSGADNLLPGDDNPGPIVHDVFLRDRRTGTLRRLNAPLGPGNADFATISADSRHVAFNAETNGTYHVYVYEVRTGRLERADLDMDAGFTGGETPSLSADGRYVAFLGRQGTVPPPNEDLGRIYVRDRKTGTTRRASRIPAKEGRGYDSPRISADGGKVAYRERSRRGGGPGGERDWADIHLADLRTGEQRQIDTTADGLPATSGSTDPLISADGRTVVFNSAAKNIVPVPDEARSYVFVRDVRSGAIRRVDGIDGNQYAEADAIGPDGRLLLLHSAGVEYGLYVKDLKTGKDTLVSPGTDGRPRAATAGPDGMTADGRAVVFESHLADLVGGDTNHESDVFLRHVR
ncbi:TolB family protein [Streptomyces sp. CB02923]|uniref:TolB family protein n=1 Tax=Streptomyces sp. CB02923 TaxID=1718985 RepID=UPI00190104C8|nr:PD40 domain-containing protein [Streptomyces sp. CB02923]